MGWSSQVIVARVVIVEGPGGGLFVYNGTPGAGNPPVFAVVAPGVTKDLYGNAVEAVVTAGSLTGAHVGIDDHGRIFLAGSSGKTTIELDPGNENISFYPAGAGSGELVMSLASAAGTDQYGNTIPAGFYAVNLATGQYVNITSGALRFGVVGTTDTEGVIEPDAGSDALQLISPTSALVSIPAELTLQSSAEPYGLLNGGLYTTTTATSGTKEDWHTVTLPSGWSGYARVKKLALGSFAVFDFNITGAGAGTVFGSFPSDHYPQNGYILPLGLSGANQGTNPRLVLPASGNPSFAGLPATTPNQVTGTYGYPLD